MYEVNVWGMVAMIKAFSPLLIRGKGTIVNIASIAGPLCPPWMGKSTRFFLSPSLLYRGMVTGKGLYSGSKSCMATISETLRLEMKPLGVNVITVITGAIETNIFTNAPEQQPLPEDSLYKPA
jgi:1-acylglycerone phosphate reductase